MYCYNAAVVNANVLCALSGAGGVPNQRLVRVMRGYAAECKFKYTGDLFIWSILLLKMPSWTTASFSANEQPFSVASRVFTHTTNAVVQPLVKTCVQDLLDKYSDKPLFTFCILAAMVLEITTAPKYILVGPHALAANPKEKTLAVTLDFQLGGVSGACGYVFGGTFYHFADPYVAIAKWSQAYDSSSPLSLISASESCELDNPLMKFA
tara:strand:+ start:1913 stop:2539 length:627 start_codon:yes stop_codon:yes gene_type:complete